MKVRELIELLSQCDPEAEVLVNAYAQGLVVANMVHRRKEHGGIGGRYSFETIPTVEVLKGVPSRMRKQGWDVLGAGCWDVLGAG